MSLLNYGLFVLSCLTCLVRYVLSCITCCMFYVVSCPTCSCVSCYSCPMCSCALRSLCPACSRASCASCTSCSHTSRTPYLTYSTVNHYDMQSLLMECYYSGFFHKRYKPPGSINLRSLHYINSLTCIHWETRIIKRLLNVAQVLLF